MEWHEVCSIEYQCLKHFVGPWLTQLLSGSWQCFRADSQTAEARDSAQCQQQCFDTVREASTAEGAEATTEQARGARQAGGQQSQN